MRTPFDIWRAGFEVARLGVEAHAVICMRTLGMTGAWNTPFDETWRMWREKPDAFVVAMGRGAEAILQGKTPERVMSEVLVPLTIEATQNRQRLSARGRRR